MRNLILYLKIKTRPIRIYYLIKLRLFILRKIITINDALIKSNKFHKNLTYKFDSLILPKSQKLKIYSYPYSLRMEAAATYAKLRASIFPFRSIKNDNLSKKIVFDLNNKGHSNKIPIKIPTTKCNDVIKYFLNQPSLFVHSYDPGMKIEYKSPLKVLKKKNRKLPKYISYDYSSQFYCEELLKLMINPRLIKIAYNYLGCIPKIQYLNTFWTLPSKEDAWLANYHRDLDDYLCLTVMVNWTDTLENNSGTSFIKGSHRPSPELTLKLIKSQDKSIHNKKNIRKSSDENIFNLFRESSYPGYGQNERYYKIFSGTKDFLSSSGKQGTISLQNNEGLHCGPIFEGERLISWIRYGCSGGVDTRSINTEQIKLNQNLKEILKEEEYGFLIKELFY